MKTLEEIVCETAQKLHNYHLGKGSMPDWNDLFQGFTAAHDLLVEKGALRRDTRT